METKGEGWLIFAAIALGIAGVMRIFDAIWAFRVHNQSLTYGILGDSVKTYGWIWLLVGIVLILCAFALSQQSQMARWIGIVAGAVCAITSIWWMPYYPIWSLTYVAIGIGVVYALAAYGSRDREVTA